jgi:hypothetical protein
VEIAIGKVSIYSCIEEDGSIFMEWVLTDDETIEPAPYNPDISPRQYIEIYKSTHVLYALNPTYLPPPLKELLLPLVTPSQKPPQTR